MSLKVLSTVKIQDEKPEIQGHEMMAASRGRNRDWVKPDMEKIERAFRIKGMLSCCFSLKNQEYRKRKDDGKKI